MLASIIDGTVRARLEACDYTLEMHAVAWHATEKLRGFLSPSKASFLEGWHRDPRARMSVA